MAVKTKRQKAATQTPEEQREKALADARAEVEGRVRQNEEWHRAAQRKGAREQPHEQEKPSAEVIHSDRPAAEGATIAVEVGHDPNHPQDVGQEALGMKPLGVKRGVAGGAIQPSARTKNPWTLPTTTKEDGKTPLTFVNPGSGNPLGTQQAKASGAQQVLTGGPGTGGTVFADLPSSGNPPTLPTFSDRVGSDADVNAGAVVPSGAVNPMRLGPPVAVSDSTEHAKGSKGVTLVGADRPVFPEIVASDRLASREEEMTVVATPESKRDKPVSGGGELLGMGETVFLGGPPHKQPTVMQADRLAQTEAESVIEAQDVKPSKAARAGASRGKKAAKAAKRPSARKRPSKPATAVSGPQKQIETKAQAVPRSHPQAPLNPTKEETGMEIETKDVKSTPSTEQKDKPLETGTKAPSEGE